MPDQDDLNAVSYDKTGRIRIHVPVDADGEPNGTLHTLRPATLGQFREVKDALQAVRTKTQAVAAERGIEDLANPKPTDDLEGLDDITLDLFAACIQLIFNGHPDSTYLPTGLSDQRLPDDPQRWPVWLLLDETLIGKMLDHWRQVPLARS
jgi:hypothetical protein